MDKGFNHEKNAMRLAELGLHLTLGPNGQILVVKRRVARGQSETLYKWTGDQPQTADLLPKPGELRSIN